MKVSIANVLRKNNVASFVEVLMDMEKLKRSDFEDWRFGRTPFLERVIQVNLSSVNFLLRSFASYCKEIGLTPSYTAYMRWGKGPKRQLRFSKSGDYNLERAYATHYLTKKKVKETRMNTPTAANVESTKAKQTMASRGKGKKRKEAPDVQEQRVLEPWEWEMEGFYHEWGEAFNPESGTAPMYSNPPSEDNDLPF